MKRFLTQQLIISRLFILFSSLSTYQLWAADAPFPNVTPPSARFAVAPSGGNGKVDIKQWNFAAIATGNAWFTQNPPTHQSTGTAYGDFPTRTPATTNTETGYSGYLTIAPGATGATGGQFVTVEGYLIMPCYASSVQLRVKDSLTEQYSSLHLAINGGTFTTSSADLTKVSEEKINEANAIVTSSEYTVLSTNYGRWVRFGVAISNGRLAFSSRLEWNLNGNGWATIPSTAFSSITGGTGLLVTTSPLCAAVAPSANCTDATSTAMNTYASQAAADAAIAAATYTLSDTRPFEDYTAPSTNMHTYCVTYTTGATETRIGVRNFVSQISTCTFTRTYAVTKMDCSTPATFVSSGNGSYNSFYYAVEPNTQYRVCATITGFTGTGCLSVAVGGVFPTTTGSATLVFNTTPAPATFAFNCGTAAVTGTFLANGVGGQTGTLTVPITGATAGSAIFNVSGTGFTGTLGTILTAGQTSVVIPITYDGTGAARSQVLTVTSAQGTGACTTNASVYNNTDTDGDGILDYADIDDDNDGILDTAETGCFTFPSKPSITATSGLTVAASIGILLDGAEANSFYYGNQTVSNSNIAEFTFPAPANLTKIEITTDIATSFMANGLTYKVQGWNGTAYVDVTSVLTSNGACTATTTGGSTFSVAINFASNTAFYSKYRILGISGSISNAPYVREAHFTGSYSCTEADTDNDGIVNRLDLDSDNDGCSDAQEGGATTILTANYQFTGAVGTNGLVNSLETVADNGIINYTPTYSRATDASLKACTDTDGDGILDIVDIDDDNDGVLDVVENNCTNPNSATTYPTTTGVTSIDWQNIGATLTSTGGSFQNNLLGTVTITGTAGSQIVIGAGNNSGTYLQFANQAHTLTFSWTKPVTSMVLPLADMDFNEEVTLTATGATFTPLLLGPTDYWTAPNILGGTGNDLNSDAANYSNVKVDAPSGITSITLTFKNIGIAGQNALLDVAILSMLTPCNADVDNDGITNDKDLDSDGDGCSDAYEAGATTNTTANYVFTGAVGTNGLVNSLETVADNGVINYTSTYNNALNNAIKSCIASFNFNCGTAAVTGTFLANGVGGQTGTLTVPITGATAGSAIFNVSGTGFTGTLGTILTAGQTSVVIPITYDGTGAIGSRTLTVTSAQGTGTCTKAATVTTPPPAFSYPYNCAGAIFKGTFIANGITGQTGTVIVPITVAQGGSVTFTATGTNISGSSTTTIATGQAAVTLPITYTGAGTEGSRLLTITAPEGTGTCTLSVPIQASCKANGGRIGQ